MTATNVTEIAPGLWEFDLPPHQIRHFGNTANAIGARSVLVFREFEFDAAAGKLHFDADDVTPINVGTTSSVIGLAAHPNEGETTPHDAAVELVDRSYGPGDRAFLRLAKSELSAQMYRAAQQLLSGVRRRSPGDLKRGQSRNFSDTPDNFWYVIVQPRISELSITVRGSVDHFRGIAKIEIKDDRGNTRFKVRSEDDVASALEMIFHAIRKG